jgi:hypothetical protein
MRKSCDSFRGGVVKEQAAAIGRRSKDARLRLDDVEIEFVELKVASNVRAERAEGVRERGGFEAGMKFLGDRAAPEDFAPFEHCGLEAALGQIKCGDQCVVTATD